VPFTVKDVIATEGVRTTLGSLLFADHVPTWTATAVSRLQQAGAVLIGKTNTPEFALDPHTDNRIFGPTVNPLDAELTPGGSSGGEGSAVAAGLSAFGVGSDYGGSLRWPAQCNGIHAIRPTPGLVPGTGLLPSDPELSMVGPSSTSLMGGTIVMGPLARSVEDLGAALAVMAGPDRFDVRSVPVEARAPEAVDTGSLACAWLDGDGASPATPDLAAVVERAAGALGDVVDRVDAAQPAGLEEAETIYAALRRADGLALYQELAAGHEHELTAAMQTWFSEVEPATVADFQRLTRDRDRLRAVVLDFMETYPIMVMPVSTAPAMPVGVADFHRRFEMLVPCRVISLLGLPSVAVTVDHLPNGQPAAVQVVARPFREDQALAVARALCNVSSDG
jgi:Asp-tRNA(Asn)/Glu-tRNA(Gln) amidotransferase A subunit family amidase